MYPCIFAYFFIMVPWVSLSLDVYFSIYFPLSFPSWISLYVSLFCYVYTNMCLFLSHLTFCFVCFTYVYWTIYLHTFALLSLFTSIPLLLLHTFSLFHIPISTSIHHYLSSHTYISLPLYIFIYHLTPWLSLDWYIPISLYLAHLCRFIPIPSLSFDLHISIPPTHISHYPYIYISPTLCLDRYVNLNSLSLTIYIYPSIYAYISWYISWYPHLHISPYISISLLYSLDTYLFI